MPDDDQYTMLEFNIQAVPEDKLYELYKVLQDAVRDGAQIPKYIDLTSFRTFTESIGRGTVH